MNVASIDEGVVITIQLTIMHGGLQCVGKAVLEHRRQLGVAAELLLHLDNLLVDDL